MTLLNGLGYDVKFTFAGTEKVVLKGEEIKLTPQEIACKKPINGHAVCHIQFKDLSSLPKEVEKHFISFHLLLRCILQIEKIY